METISKLTHRRFLLGQQGLWPGRRFKGLNGVEAALRQIRALQLDPLNIAARSQEIAMYGRVLDFKLEHLYQMAYERRRAFDYGGWLAMYPMEELPYWRVIMPRMMRHPRLAAVKKKHASAIEEVLTALHANGPLGNRDFAGNALSEWSYRGRKDSAVALYYLWMLGEVMISHRAGFDRFYDLRERVAPRQYDYIAPIEEAEDFFALQRIAMVSLMREKRFHFSWRDAIERGVTQAEAGRKLSELIAQGTVSRVKIEGSGETWLTLTGNLPLLESLEAGRVPKAWRHFGPTTREEVTLLAPLEMVSARGRAKQVFDFDYTWEVYKPVHLRRWGYYTLPILYGDDLVARLDPKLDRKTKTLHILGFWLEADAPTDEAFANALGRGIARFARLVGAQKVTARSIHPPKLRQQVQKFLASEAGR